MFRIKKYTYRHKILGALVEPLSKFHQEDVDANDGLMTVHEISQRSSLNKDTISQHIDYLHLEGEIYIEWIDSTSYYLISPTGTATFYDKKYLELGYSQWLKRFRDLFLLITGIVSFLLTLWTFAASVYLTKTNELEIQKLKREVNAMKKVP